MIWIRGGSDFPPHSVFLTRTHPREHEHPLTYTLPLSSHRQFICEEISRRVGSGGQELTVHFGPGHSSIKTGVNWPCFIFNQWADRYIVS